MRLHLQVDRSSYKINGFLIIPGFLNTKELSFATDLVNDLVRRHQARDSVVVTASISVGDSARLHTERNTRIDTELMDREPFIIGDLLGLQPSFAKIIVLPKIWNLAAQLLDVQLSSIVFHFSNITRKPALYGPALGWHRDADNLYYASSDRRTIRLLFPLQSMHSTNGGTEILPGSHIRNVENNSVIKCPSIPAGSCLALHSEVLHGGAPNQSKDDRDVIGMQFGLRNSVLSHHAAEMMSGSRQSAFIDFLNPRSD